MGTKKPKQKRTQRIKLGQKVRDTITGFEGIATSRLEYINGCIQYGVKPKTTKEGEMPRAEAIDQGQLEIVKEPKKVIKKKQTGGDMEIPNGGL